MARTKSYLPGPIGVVFKTSNRSNAKTKLKVFKGNWNIDRVLSEKLPGVPEKAEILAVGIGEKIIEGYRVKYKL
jgi:hypothetical protein